nr:MAG TPA: hypothetical protein [Bacteriophage sp.]
MDNAFSCSTALAVSLDIASVSSESLVVDLAISESTLLVSETTSLPVSTCCLLILLNSASIALAL